MQQRVSNQTDDKVADALKHSWVYGLPRSTWPYAQLARWERPIGWQLLMWPCWWSAALAFNAAVVYGQPSGLPSTGSTPFWLLLALHLLLYLFGAIAMRGAGCTYNDLVDENIDNQVARTRSRPLPSGRVTRKQAMLFLVAQALLGLCILIVLSQAHAFTFFLGAASLITVVIYPFMKRITWWPQLFLGLAFSWGALIGWGAVFGQLSSAPLFLYLGCIFWVIGYDTIYAHQDIEDDALVGVKSTARLFAENTARALTGLYAFALLFWAAALYAAGSGWLAWTGLALVALHLLYQILGLRIDDPAHCLRQFKSNSTLGLLFFCFLLADLVAAITI